MYNLRFDRPVAVTRHAGERMKQRDISETELGDLLEEGELRYKDTRRLWVAKRFVDRDDNLICAALVLEDRLVVKTVMHHFEWGE